MGGFYFISVNNQFRQISSHIILHDILTVCFRIISYPFVLMYLTIQKAFEHHSITSIVPGLSSIRRITCAGNVLAEWFTFKGIGNKITFYMCIALCTLNKEKIGAFYSRFPGLNRVFQPHCNLPHRRP